jgi:hypothetical protein
MDVSVRLSCPCGFLCVGRGLELGWYPIQRILQTVQDQETERGEGPTKDCIAIDNDDDDGDDDNNNNNNNNN